MAGYKVARLDEIGEIDDGRIPLRAVRHHFGIKTFGINALTAQADGERVINEHEENEPDSSEELYIVLSGHARFELDGESHEAPAGTFVHVLPGIKRTAFARDAGTTVIAIGAGREGRAYQATGWEVFAPLFPLFQSGEFEEGADRAEAILAENPDAGAPVYFNTACFQARCGRTDAALANLRRAVEFSPEYIDFVRTDDDLEALRDHPEFQKLIAG